MNKPRTERPWKVILHNDWNNSMLRVVIILKKCVPSMAYEKAPRFLCPNLLAGAATLFHFPLQPTRVTLQIY